MKLGDPDVSYPVAALDLDAVRHNVTEMDSFCADRSVLLAPHAKTTMVREVLALQLEMARTWGLTVATVAQARLAAELGAQRIMVANQLVEAADIAWVARETGTDRSVFSWVDTVAGVRWLDSAKARAGLREGMRHRVLLEVGYSGGRCGARGWADFDAVAAAVRDSQHLVLQGVAGFEGLLGGAGTPTDMDRLDDYVRRLALAAIRLADGWTVSGPEAILSAGGSAFFDRVVDVCSAAARRIGGVLLLRSGCYAVHDHGSYARTFPGARAAAGPDLRAAATVWARVQSRPESQRAVAAVGKRHVPYDAGFPVVLGVRYRDGIPGPLPAGSGVVALSDQHLHLDVAPESDLTTGDVLPLGISHPCGLFDRWREITVVDRHRELSGTVHPRF